MTIIDSTKSYEARLKANLEDKGGLDEVALSSKHTAMKQDGEHAFLRASFYHWAWLWTSEGDAGPSVLSVGDTHVENFGTWRDADSRFVWGVNDFDEVCLLPYTSDLVRLGVSANFALKELDGAPITIREACDAILSGYANSVADPIPKPLVLAENYGDLRKIAFELIQSKSPAKFWDKWEKKTIPSEGIPADALARLQSALPSGTDEVVLLEPSPDKPPGMGSRGKRRWYAKGLWNGAKLLREIKALTPSASAWATSNASSISQSALIQSKRRSPDPTQQMVEKWSVRRLAYDAEKIELGDLLATQRSKSDWLVLFSSMGHEIGNLHADSDLASAITQDLTERGDNGWFSDAVIKWSSSMSEAQQEYIAFQ